MIEPETPYSFVVSAMTVEYGDMNLVATEF